MASKGSGTQGGAIASPHALSTEAGVAAYRAGGNALDAALAAAASLTVTLPDNCGPGGDLIALTREPAGKVLVVNASGPAPAAIPVDDLRRGGSKMPRYGPHAVTVPGALAGWGALWSLGARLPWAEVFSAAIAQARDGVPVSKSVAAALVRDAARLHADEGMREVFFANRRARQHLDPLRQPQLAATLEIIARDGANSFYRGELGSAWVGAMSNHGATLSHDDLESYEAELCEPLSARHGTEEVITAPPNSQGAIWLLILALLDAHDPPPDALSEQAPILASAFRAAANARDHYLADPRFADVPVERLLSPGQFQRPDPRPPVPSRARRTARGDTVAVVAVDAEGRAVSLIQSLFDSFGAGILDPRTGIIAHNRGTFFSLDPGSPNVVAGGKRPVHTLTPALICDHGELRAVMGTMGGQAQPQILTQILQRVREGWDCQEALAAPRWLLGGIELDGGRERVLAEGRVPAEALNALTKAGWPTTRLSDSDPPPGQAQLLVRSPSGSYCAASDPRGEGSARVL